MSTGNTGNSAPEQRVALKDTAIAYWAMRVSAVFFGALLVIGATAAIMNFGRHQGQQDLAGLNARQQAYRPAPVKTVQKAADPAEQAPAPMPWERIAYADGVAKEAGLSKAVSSSEPAENNYVDSQSGQIFTIDTRGELIPVSVCENVTPKAVDACFQLCRDKGDSPDCVENFGKKILAVCEGEPTATCTSSQVGMLLARSTDRKADTAAAAAKSLGDKASAIKADTTVLRARTNELPAHIASEKAKGGTLGTSASAKTTPAPKGNGGTLGTSGKPPEQKQAAPPAPKEQPEVNREPSQPAKEQPEIDREPKAGAKAPALTADQQEALRLWKKMEGLAGSHFREAFCETATALGKMGEASKELRQAMPGIDWYLVSKKKNDCARFFAEMKQADTPVKKVKVYQRFLNLFKPKNIAKSFDKNVIERGKTAIKDGDIIGVVSAVGVGYLYYRLGDKVWDNFDKRFLSDKEAARIPANQIAPAGTVPPATNGPIGPDPAGQNMGGSEVLTDMGKPEVDNHAAGETFGAQTKNIPWGTSAPPLKSPDQPGFGQSAAGTNGTATLAGESLTDMGDKGQADGPKAEEVLSDTKPAAPEGPKADGLTDM